MSVSGTPVTTYDDGFPKAHPSLPPSTRRSSRGVVHRRTLGELTDDHGRTQACRRKVGGPQPLQFAHERPPPRFVAPTGTPAERAGGGGGALGNPSSYVGTGVPATDRRAVGQTVRSGFPRPHPPGGSAAIGSPQFRTGTLRKDPKARAARSASVCDRLPAIGGRTWLLWEGRSEEHTSEL